MNAQALLDNLHAEGARLQAEGGHLYIDTPRPLSTERLSELAACKPDLLRLLRGELIPEPSPELPLFVEAIQPALPDEDGDGLPGLAAPTEGLSTVMGITSAQMVSRLLAVLFPDAQTALDTTFGSGKFWDGSARVRVTGMDINPQRAPDIVGDFTRLPFKDGAFDVVIFDPPYHTDVGRGKVSVMGARFGHYATIPELKEAVELGVRESWRVARLGLIVKVQDYIHGQKAVWMSDWVKQALLPIEPFDFAMTLQPRKLNDPKWKNQYSVRRNHAVYWVFRKDGDKHVARTPAAAGPFPPARTATTDETSGWAGSVVPTQPPLPLAPADPAPAPVEPLDMNGHASPDCLVISCGQPPRPGAQFLCEAHTAKPKAGP